MGYKGGSKVFVKGDRVHGYGGYYYVPLPGFTYGWLNTKYYPSLTKAMKACSANGSCSGVTKIKARKYRLNGGKTLKKAASYILYQRQGFVVSRYKMYYGQYVWQAWSPYSFTKHLSAKVYKSLPVAMDACVENPKCKGVTRHGNKKYKLYKRSVYLVVLNYQSNNIIMVSLLLSATVTHTRVVFGFLS